MKTKMFILFWCVQFIYNNITSLPVVQQWKLEITVVHKVTAPGDTIVSLTAYKTSQSIGETKRNKLQCSPSSWNVGYRDICVAILCHIQQKQKELLQKNIIIPDGTFVFLEGTSASWASPTVEGMEHKNTWSGYIKGQWVCVCVCLFIISKTFIRQPPTRVRNRIIKTFVWVHVVGRSSLQDHR